MTCLRALFIFIIIVTEGQYAFAETGRPMREGVGKYFTTDGTIYSGTWRNDCLSGPMCYVHLVAQQVKYKGSMVCGEYDGRGTYSSPEYMYEGVFSNGQ